MNIVEFLRARLDEDEAAAKSATAMPWSSEHGMGVRAPTGYYVARRVENPANRRHIARHDPVRVLREVEAKRRIVDLAWHHLGDDDYAWGMEEAKRQVLVLMASVYADHPDYDPAWTVG